MTVRPHLGRGATWASGHRRERFQVVSDQMVEPTPGVIGPIVHR
jgi:hypothetical protein